MHLLGTQTDVGPICFTYQTISVVHFVEHGHDSKQSMQVKRIAENQSFVVNIIL